MDRIDEIINRMSIEDKVSFCTGKNFWQTKDFEKYGIPSIFMCDGPLGLRKQELDADMLGVNDSRKATCFPAEVTTANSFNTDLLERIGVAFGEEAIDQGVDLVLGPGANIKRNPLCGRNFEYFSEDPYHAGKLAASFIRGIESKGVGSSLKHFAVNSQELSRFNSNGFIDERTLREMYLTAFEIAVKEGNPSTVMCSYPKLNDVHCSENKYLLTDILRNEWGFEGFVVTDWGAMADRIEGFKAGCDLNMPGGSKYMEKETIKALKEGILSEEDVNRSVRRILEFVFRAREKDISNNICDYEVHHKLSKEAAIEGAVLLKNEDKLLPLNKDERISVIGYMAKHMRYQGAGSSHINAYKLSEPLDNLSNYDYAEGYLKDGSTTDELIKEAIATAKKNDKVVIFAGLPERYESEGFDREEMSMPLGHLRMIEEVSKANPNTIVVLLCGSAVELPFKDNVKSILYMGLPGEAGGEAIKELLYGEANPSGRLCESWPIKYSDVPSSDIYRTQRDALYAEGIYLGYRYYDKVNKEVAYPFGHGLSYTTFKYSNLKVDGLKVSVDVSNTGETEGKEVVQLYVHNPQDSIHRPIRELKGFTKVSLKPNETKTVSFELDDRSFSIYDNGFKKVKGSYVILIADLKETVEVDGETIDLPEYQKDSFYETCKGKPSLSELEMACGRKYNKPVLKKGNFTMDDSVKDLKDHSLIMKIMYKATEMVIAKGFGGKVDYNNPEFVMMMESSAGSTLRSMEISGGMPPGVMKGMLDMANGHFFRGIFRMMGL